MAEGSKPPEFWTWLGAGVSCFFGLWLLLVGCVGDHRAHRRPVLRRRRGSGAGIDLANARQDTGRPQS